MWRRWSHLSSWERFFDPVWLVNQILKSNLSDICYWYKLPHIKYVKTRLPIGGTAFLFVRKCVNILTIRVRYHFYKVFGVKQTFSETSGYLRAIFKTHRKIFSSFLPSLSKTYSFWLRNLPWKISKKHFDQNFFFKIALNHHVGIQTRFLRYLERP